MAPRSQVAAVVKANAYGHGLEPLSAALSGQVDAFAVATIEEGINLRRWEHETPVWILLGFSDATELHACLSFGLTPVIQNDWQCSLLRNQKGFGLPVILELDIGMGRLGFDFADSGAQLLQLEQHGIVSIQAILGHLPGSEEGDANQVRDQCARFLRESAGFKKDLTLANSAAIMDWPDTHLDWVRPGLMLYGVAPHKHRRGVDFGLKPAMRVFSRIHGIRNMRVGDTIGYGRTFRCSTATRVALVRFGYADGYPRSSGDQRFVSLHGQACAILGRIAMDSMMVDVSASAAAQVGDIVEMWGGDIATEQLAADAGTIPHELLSHLGPRVELRFI